MQTRRPVPEGSRHARLASGLKACGLRADPAYFLATWQRHVQAIRHILLHVRRYIADDDVEDDDADDGGA